jgi:hypothetical protein
MNQKSLLTPAGAALALICFFLPWAKIECMGVSKNISGSEIGGAVWLVFAAALAVLAAFYYFRSINNIEKSKPIIAVAAIVALVVMAWKYVSLLQGIKTEMGTITAKDLNMKIGIGAIGSSLGFLLVLFGLSSLVNSQETASPTALPSKPTAQVPEDTLISEDLEICPHCLKGSRVSLSACEHCGESKQLSTTSRNS